MTMYAPTQIELPLARIGGVNVWLLEGEPMTLIDTGAGNKQTLLALEEQLNSHGVALENIELVLLTHHHPDHSGLATAIKERSGALIAAHRETARWWRQFGERNAAEQKFTRRLMEAHGVPAQVIASSDQFFARIFAGSRPFDTDLVLSDGDRITAGGRTLRVVYRPGHSTTDTLFVDEDSDEAYVGDHLLANITTGAELMPTDWPGDERRQGLLEYLGNLGKTQAMALNRCYTGHGPTIEHHRELIEARRVFHNDRLERIEEILGAGGRTAFEVARRLWSDETAEGQPVLVTWEVLGHLDVLLNRGTVREEVDEQGRHYFMRRETIALAS